MVKKCASMLLKNLGQCFILLKTLVGEEKFILLPNFVISITHYAEIDCVQLRLNL